MHPPASAPTPREGTFTRDGLQLVVRHVQPSDAPLIARGFSELGAESRYQRFFMPKARLSSDELHTLTRSDGLNSFVLGLVARDERGDEQPVGVARYVRSVESPDVAEAAVTIVDAMQGKGLGQLLLHELAAAARVRGIARFRCMMLSENVAIHKLLRSLDPHPRLVAREPGCDVYEATLDGCQAVPSA